MIRWRLTEPPGKFQDPRKPRKQVEVILRADGPDARAPIELEGDESLATKVFERLLTACYGFRGGFIERETTPLDLEIAMKSPPMSEFEPERVA